MKYRTKLYISLVAVALASIVLGLVIFSKETEKLILHMLGSRSLSIVATAAAQVDPELFKQIKSGTTVSDPNYIKARQQLKKIVDANRRDDIYVSDLYTLFVDPDDKNVLLFGVETDPNPYTPGTVYPDSDEKTLLKNRDKYYIEPNYVTNQYGVWLSAFAPIRDENGNYVATLGLDINAADVHFRLEQLIKFSLYGLSASLILSFILGYFLSKRVTQSLDHLCFVVGEIEQGNFETKAELYSDDEFGTLALRINEMARGLQERERLKLSFARYVSSHILDEILESDSPLKLEGERKKVTILFSDIRKFTELAENLPPEDVVHLLNEYFEQMIEVIFSHGGTLDKFIGDGIMAEFGVPLDDQKQEENAIRAALEMHKALDRLCDQWEKEGKPRISMGIGIHTGEAILGSIGSELRAEYTAVGNAVIVAARLEQATKTLGVSTVISESTYLGAKNQFPFRDLGTTVLPGRQEEIHVYTVEDKG